MAIIRDFNNSESIINYVGTLAFFCAITCSIIMLKFRGFRASLNFGTEKGANVEHYETFSGVSLTGAYKSSNEFVGNINYPNPQKRIRPSMVKLPNLQPATTIKSSKSTNDLISPETETANIRNSSPNILQTDNNNVELTKDQIKEQKNLEKQRLAEQRKRDRLAAQEQKKREKIAAQEQKREKLAAQQQQKRDKLAAQEQLKRDKLEAQEQQKQEKLAAKEQQKQEKLRKDAEKRAQQSRPAQDRSNAPNRSAPPPPPPLPSNQPLVANPKPVAANPQTQTLVAYSTNTLESSISRSSGPPPYSSIPEVIPNELDDTGNTSFSKPAADSGSWDMITQHRQQLHRPAGVSKGAIKQTHLNLNYNAANSKVSQDNSNA